MKGDLILFGEGDLPFLIFGILYSIAFGWFMKHLAKKRKEREERRDMGLPEDTIG